MFRQRRQRTRRPSLTIGVMDLGAMCDFFEAIGWAVEPSEAGAVVSTPSGRFGLAPEDEPPRLELALSVPDALHVDEIAEVVDEAGGIMMEPLQETVWGGWGFSFNDPEGNTWELGSPLTVTAYDRFLSTGARPSADGPIVALCVPRRRLPGAV